MNHCIKEVEILQGFLLHTVKLSSKSTEKKNLYSVHESADLKESQWAKEYYWVKKDPLEKHEN